MHELPPYLEQSLCEADPAIREILPAINHFIRGRYPAANFQTIDSCSGHINPDGSLLHQKNGIGIVVVKHPYLYYWATSMQEAIAHELDVLLAPAVTQLNHHFEQDIMSIDHRPRRQPIRSRDLDSVLNFLLTPTGEAIAGQILPQFWTNVSLELQRSGTHPGKTVFSREEFIRTDQLR